MNAKQKKFVELAIQYAPDFVKAYQEAYNTPSQGAAKTNCSRLLKNADVKQAIDHGLAEIAGARTEAAKETAKSEAVRDILTQGEALEILSKIARGEARQIGKRKIIPNDRDRISAIEKSAQMSGWNAATENIVKFSTVPKVIIQAPKKKN